MEYHQSTPASNPTPNPNNSIDPDAKVLSDLSLVQEKIALCQSMLVNVQSTIEIDSQDSLLAVIGFLEACVPRVRELINVGMTLLKEETLTKCFLVNDELCKILNDVEHPEKVVALAKDSSAGLGSSTGSGVTSGDMNTKPSPGNNGDGVATSIAAAQNDGADIFNSLDFDAFGFEEQKQAVKGDDGDGDDHESGKPATTSTASATLEDLLAPPTSVPPTASAANTTSSTSTKNDGAQKEKKGDEFDDFFGQRESNNSFSIDE
jgi:hypothetical protein